MGASGPAPGPPQTPRSLEARVLTLEKKIGFLMYAWQRVAFERSDQRAEIAEALIEMRNSNAEMLEELKRIEAPTPQQPP